MQTTTSFATAKFDGVVTNLGIGLSQDNNGVFTITKNMRLQLMVMLWIEANNAYKRGNIVHTSGTVRKAIADAINETTKYWCQVTLNTIVEVKAGDKLEIKWGGSGNEAKTLNTYEQGTQINIVEI